MSSFIRLQNNQEVSIIAAVWYVFEMLIQSQWSFYTPNTRLHTTSEDFAIPCGS